MPEILDRPAAAAATAPRPAPLDIAQDPPAIPSPVPTPVACAQPEASAALALHAAMLDAPTLTLGAHRLAAALAALGGFDRVTVGLRERPDGGGRIRLIANSLLDLDQLPAELRERLAGAMDEALEQGESLAYPPPPGRPAPVLLEQRQLRRLAGGAVATVPLGRQGIPLGAICVQRLADGAVAPFGAAELHQLEQQLMLAAPALQWLRDACEPWHRRLWRALHAARGRLLQPEHRRARWALAGGAVAALVLLLWPLPQSIGGRARVEGAEQRVIAAPSDGFVKAAHVRPGDRVRAGAPLVDLLDADLRLERERWGSQVSQHENAYAAAMAKSDRVTAATSMARIVEAQAQLALVDEQLSRGRLVAPFDAQVVQGDLSQSIGGPVRQGDTLLTLATAGRHRVIVEVDEVDIAGVQPGQQGALALSSLPGREEALVVERIAPLARVVEGRNVFEVEARLLAPQQDLRPGLLGRAWLEGASAPLAWAWTRRALLRLRVAMWAWLA